MQLRFGGRTVLVTGASTGIGAAVARAFGTAGPTVAVHYRDSAEAAKGDVSAIESASAVLFLASEDAAGCVTGQMLEVNGGQFSP